MVSKNDKSLDWQSFTTLSDEELLEKFFDDEGEDFNNTVDEYRPDQITVANIDQDKWIYQQKIDNYLECPQFDLLELVINETSEGMGNLIIGNDLMKNDGVNNNNESEENLNEECGDDIKCDEKFEYSSFDFFELIMNELCELMRRLNLGNDSENEDEEMPLLGSRTGRVKKERQVKNYDDIEYFRLDSYENNNNENREPGINPDLTNDTGNVIDGVPSPSSEERQVKDTTFSGENDENSPCTRFDLKDVISDITLEDILRTYNKDEDTMNKEEVNYRGDSNGDEKFDEEEEFNKSDILNFNKGYYTSTQLDLFELISDEGCEVMLNTTYQSIDLNDNNELQIPDSQPLVAPVENLNYFPCPNFDLLSLINSEEYDDLVSTGSGNSTTSETTKVTKRMVKKLSTSTKLLQHRNKCLTFPKRRRVLGTYKNTCGKLDAAQKECKKNVQITFNLGTDGTKDQIKKSKKNKQSKLKLCGLSKMNEEDLDPSHVFGSDEFNERVENYMTTRLEIPKHNDSSMYTLMFLILAICAYVVSFAIFTRKKTQF